MITILVYFLLVIISALGLWLAHWYLRVRHFEKYLSCIPNPPLIPLLGNALEFGSSVTILSTLMKYHHKFKGNFKIYIGSQPFIFFSDPKDLEFLLNSPILLRKSDPYRFLHSWLGTGLLTSWGDKWRKHRKIITPAFHFQILEEFVDVFNSAGDILVRKLAEQCDKSSVDIYPFVTRCALDIICETAMGTSVNAQDDVDSEYVKCVDILLGILIDRAFSPFLQNEFLYRFSNTYRIEQQALKVVHGYSRSVINKRMAEFSKSQKEEESFGDTMGIKKKKAFLDLLLEYSSKDPSFTFDDICQEVDTFMFEGHDTTATSISFALFSLAQNPDIQRKVYSELRSIFADEPKRTATYQDLQEMRYLETVIKESLRIYTTVPFFGRTIEEDTVTPNVVIPKGTMCNLFTYATHNSELSYKDPDKFDADRFSIENIQRKSPFAFVPFSAGFRNCIGQKFAMLEMKSTISNVLRNFELFPAVPEHKVVLKSAAVLKSYTGVVIGLKRRYAKVLAEQKEIFQNDYKRSAKFEDLRKMKYLKMTIMESLRIYTTVPMYARAIDKDIDWNGLLIPKHTVANASAYGVHHNPVIYPEPEKFKPERFNPDLLQTNSPFAYIPFSAGPRNCIGQKFALLQMEAILSNIIRSFEVRPVIPEHKFILKSEAVLTADNGVLIRLIKRDLIE